MRLNTNKALSLLSNGRIQRSGIILFLVALYSASAWSGCPAPKDIHPQKMLFGQGDNANIESLRLVTSDGWVSAKYSVPPKIVETFTLKQVNIASLEPRQHGIECIYSIDSSPTYHFSMYEPHQIKEFKIRLNNEKEWQPFFKSDKALYGYMCEVITAGQCGWGT